MRSDVFMSGDGSVYGLKRNRVDSIEFRGYRGFYSFLECFKNANFVVIWTSTPPL